MATAMDSPSIYPESPNDQEDVVYPCKGCGEILEEGKAFELAGNRWHIDCFRCNTCGTLLDSDANLLLLGDGSLICNNCTYSCNACGNKIEDLAILTGDQAFCASCFRCRNCKRKIENLRYARTSQGIFCMSCHESLMARRRKKAKGAPRQAQGGANGSSSVIEKALPSLPPGAASSSAFSPDLETPPSEPYVETSGALSPRQQQLGSRQQTSSSNMRRDVSPMSDEAQRDGPTLPASTYGEPVSRPSNVSDDSDDGEERGFLPMAFDPTLAPGPPPSIARKPARHQPDPLPIQQNENRPARDYFNGRLSARPAPHREALREDARPGSSRSVSTEREPDRSRNSPHILYQEKGRHKKRDTSGHNTPVTSSNRESPTVTGSQDARPERPKPHHLDTGSFTLHSNEAFKLQEVPKDRKASRGSSRAEGKSPVLVSPIESKKADGTEKNVSNSPVSLDSPSSGVNPFDDPKRHERSDRNREPTPIVAPPPRHADRPVRGDSLAAALKATSAAPEPPTPPAVQTSSTAPTRLASKHGRHSSASSVPSSFAETTSTISRDNRRSKPVEASPFRGSFDQPPPRASSRPSAPSKSVANGDFIAPRQPPPPPPGERHIRNHESVSTLHSNDARSDSQLSPAMRSAGLPKHSGESGFSMEEEMARILRGDKRDYHAGEVVPASVLRRVSNAVKHGRSYSDRAVTDNSQSPPSRSLDISSPMNMGSPAISSPTAQDPLEQLRSQNRRQAQQIAEQQAELDALRDQVNNSAYIKAATSELKEKRNTISVLDTQREVVVAELESMTAHLKKAKDSNQPLDYNSLKSDVLKDFGDSLQRLKDSLTGQIEDLMQKRNDLTSEIGMLIQMKDKGFQEFEALQTRNAQLIEMNNQLVHNIQETYKANRAPNGAAAMNGLGIYHPGAKSETPGASDLRNLNLVSTDSSMPNLLQETEAEPATVLTAPQVVNIRKGQPKKFNWRKGGEKMAKNITKGVKGAFVGEPTVRGKEIGMPYNNESIGVPYGQMSQQAGAGSEAGSLNGKQGIGAPGQGFGFFGQKSGGGLKAGGTGLGNGKNGSSTNLAAGIDPSTLFGSDLEARCDYEKHMLPNIVMRCIEEVESRGMDVEGIYRKSGGNTQVKAVQAGFEKEGNYDLSDPDLDIHAVTSALKQYFRKLPTPLVTYDVYETFLEAGSTQDKEKQAYNLRMAVAELPEAHRNCLEFLIQHLARVMAHEKENLMTPLNLSVVFAPTIMRPLSIEREMSDMQAQRTAVQALLDQHQTIFPEGD